MAIVDYVGADRFAPDHPYGYDFASPPVARSLRVLASALTQVYREAAHDSVVYLTADRAAALERICAPSLQDTIFLTFLKSLSTDLLPAMSN